MTATRAEVDLRREDEVEAWMRKNRPDAVFLAAARVGGMLVNATSPADFLYDNLILQANVIQRSP
ncbi:nucleoside-diphosphate-sugar epimerase [Rhizobium pisi]|uniref:Nucleoside-diphosphate-sugar epimerase n=1 Tax=Rhizobium pisi TaxID=574561 RepID=A0A7W5BIL6_9HYPH|nr:nucleoside-diphosphate-sugar epimerase [Rhizobium pisi]